MDADADEPVWLMVTQKSGSWSIPGGKWVGGYDDTWSTTGSDVYEWGIVEEGLREMKAVLGPSAIGNPVAWKEEETDGGDILFIVWIKAEENPGTMWADDSLMSGFLKSHDPEWGDYCWCTGMPDNSENLADWEKIVRKLLDWKLRPRNRPKNE